MTIDRKELFTLAWAIARQEQWSRRLPSVRGLFADALRSAWREMKRRAAIAAQRAVPSPRAAADLLAAIREIENRDRLRAADLDRLSELRRAYAHAATQQAESQPKPVAGHWAQTATARATTGRPARPAHVTAFPQHSVNSASPHT